MRPTSIEHSQEAFACDVYAHRKDAQRTASFQTPIIHAKHTDSNPHPTLYSPRLRSTMPKLLRLIKAPFKKRREHTDIKYLQFTDHRCFNNRRCYGENGDDDGETCSILTVSSNATMDNIPGTGRTIDTYVYQFFGRKLERFIFRGSMATLSPDRIFQYLWVNHAGIFLPMLRPLSDVIVRFSKDEVSGLKGLVKQTQ